MVYVFLFMGAIYIGLRLMAIYKAVNEEYSNVFVRMHHGITVMDKLRHNDIHDDKVKSAIIIRHTIDIIAVLLLFITFQYFIYSALIFSGVILINSVMLERYLKKTLPHSSKVEN